MMITKTKSGVHQIWTGDNLETLARVQVSADIATGEEDTEITIRYVKHLEAINAEMLEALKIAERSIQHRKGDCYSNDYMGVCVCGKDKIKAAIAKAEGKE